MWTSSYSLFVFYLVIISKYSSQLVVEKESEGLIQVPHYHYEQMYRDFTYRNMTDSARTLFFAINIHPSCLAKKGSCIPRGKCIAKKMFYIARICYWWDLVCCYEDYPPAKNPVIAMLRTVGIMGKDDRSVDNSSHILTPLEYSNLLTASNIRMVNMTIENMTDVVHSHEKTKLPKRLDEQPKTRDNTMSPILV